MIESNRKLKAYSVGKGREYQSVVGTHPGAIDRDASITIPFATEWGLPQGAADVNERRQLLKTQSSKLLLLLCIGG